MLERDVERRELFQRGDASPVASPYAPRPAACPLPNNSYAQSNLPTKRRERIDA
jgi:hypothetical protein